MMRNRAEFVLAWLAAARLGAVQVPVNVDYRGPFFEHLVNTAAADGADRRGRAPRRRDRIGRQARAPSHRRRRRRRAAHAARARSRRSRSRRCSIRRTTLRPATAVAPSDIGAIHFTSGTSGPSKGAVLPHAHLHLLSERNRELLDLRAGDTYLTELPLFHINAQMSVYSALLVGARVRIEQRFSASSWLDRVRASKRDPHVAARRHARVHPQAARPAGGRRHAAPARLVGALPARPRDHLPRPLRAGGDRHVLREHRGRHGRAANARRAAGLGRAGRPRPLRDPGRRRATTEDVPPGEVGELLVRSAAALDDDAGVLRDARAHARGVPQPLVPHRRRRAARRRREPVVRRPDQGPDPAAGREHRLGRRRDRPARAPPRGRRRRDRRAGRRGGRRGRDQGRGRRRTRTPRSTRPWSGRGATRCSPTSPSRATSRSCRSCRRPRRPRS